MKKALVVGGGGVTGRAIVEYLEGLEEWRTVCVSRSPPSFETRARFVPIDLLDAQDVRAKMGQVGSVEHLFFAAYQAHATLEAEVGPNVAMLRNAVEIAERGGELQSVTLITGTKAYGAHLGPFKTPCKETDPRLPVPNFYYDQEDLLAARASVSGWRWSGLRPSAVCGLAVNSPMNLVAVIACYAAIRRELDLPFSYPGTAEGAHSLSQATDARLLARAALWVATEARCAGETFNISNGDLYRLETLWPIFARHFDLESAGPEPMRLSQVMAARESTWQQIVTKHGLKATRLSAMAGWDFGDYVFRRGYDNISDLTKSRRFGFGEFVDSERMFLELFERMAEQRLIPRSMGV
jgi:nucleoside-diphosphate-sugar epimerase